MKISGEQTRPLKEAILDTFTPPDLATFLLERLNKHMANIAPVTGNFENQVTGIILWFNQRGWIPKLLSALIAERADEDRFRELSYQWGLQPEVYNTEPAHPLSNDLLERLVNTDPLIDIRVFLKKLSDAGRCICRIETTNALGTTSYGTGFLVGENLLLTNYHVLEAVILDNSLANRVICKFDFEVDEAGTTINPGTDFKLDSQTPILAGSPPAELDRIGSPTLNIAWPPDCLDYALVKLAEKAGSLHYGLNAANSTSKNAPARGWINPITKDQKLDHGNIIIIQHPQAQPMKVAIGFNRIVGTDTSRQRVRYSVNTMAGSSGSPCFDAQFNWIALHNMGDPNYNAAYNQGIIAHRIFEDLQKKGHLPTSPSAT